MAYRYKIVPELATGMVEVTGYVSAAVFNEATEAMMSDPHWEPHFTSLLDLSRTEVVDLMPQDLEEFLVRYVAGR